MYQSNSLHSQQLPEDSRERILSEDYVSLIFHNETFPFNLERIPAEYLPQMVDWQYAILNAPLSEQPPNIIEQGYSTIPKLFTPLDTVSLEASGITQVQNQSFFNLTGQGILLGFVDTGIDYRHPAFRNPDGSTRIVSIWDQTIQTGALPEGFLYGSEYTAEQINAALRSPDPLEMVPTRDEIGHGTAMAGIAAGSPDETAQFSGAAPAAAIAVVKLKPAKQYLRNYFLVSEDAQVFQEDDCMLALHYLELKAKRLSMPLVICFGLGSNQGGHDGLSPLDDILTYLGYLPGNYVVAAGGNETGMGHHFFGKIGKLGDTQEVEVAVEKESRGFTMELWGFAPDLYSMGVISPLGERLSPPDPRIGTSSSASFLLDNSRVQIDYEIVEYRSGSQLIQARIERPSPGVWRFPVVSKRYLYGIIHLWLPITGVGSPDIRFLNPDPDTTVVVPACNTSLITASNYQAYANTIYLDSSWGFTRNERLKPDIAAPGVNVQVPAGNSGYRIFTGSSASAALTAGAVALLIQWGRRDDGGKLLSFTELKNFLYRGASRSSVRYYPNREWGYGALNIYGIFESLIDF